MPADVPSLDLAEPGTILYSEALASRGYRLNRFALSLRRPDNRERFVAGEAAYAAEYGLTDEEIALVRNRDWTGLLKAGGHLQAILKLAATVGVNLWHIGAHNAGWSVEMLQAACPRHVTGLPPHARREPGD